MVRSTKSIISVYLGFIYLIYRTSTEIRSNKKNSS